MEMFRVDGFGLSACSWMPSSQLRGCSSRTGAMAGLEGVSIQLSLIG